MDYPPYVTRVHYTPDAERIHERQRVINRHPAQKTVARRKRKAPLPNARRPKKYTSCGGLCPINPDRNFTDNWEVFRGRTTIQGICQTVTRKGVIARILWLIVTACGITMAVYQSWDVIQDYHGKSIIQKLSFKSKGAPFPAVTVCKAILVKMKTTATQDGANTNTDEDADEGTYFSNEGIVPSDSLSFIRKCKFGPITVNLTNPDEVLPFVNPRYGKCFTFNPGFRYVKEIDAGIGLYMLLDLIDNPDSLESEYVILVLHQAGTPPILHKTKFHRINPRELVTVKMRARELSKLKGTLDCVKPTAKKQRQQIVFYSPATPYIYTMQGCQKSCEIRRRRNRFSCYDPSAVINTTDTTPDKWSGVRLCEYNEISYDVDQDYRTPCLCVSPCREVILEDTVTIIPTTCKNPANPNEILNETSATADPRSCAVIKVSYGNVPYEIIQEQRKYSDADFWGIIGGNIGLWVGICIISLMEAVELFFHFVTTGFTKLVLRAEEGPKVVEENKEEQSRKALVSPVGGTFIDDRWVVRVAPNVVGEIKHYSERNDRNNNISAYYVHHRESDSRLDSATHHGH